MIKLPTRRAFAVGTTVLGLSATSGARAQTNNGDTMSLGSATAPVHLEEYASAACSHCAHFHAMNWASLKTNYIDTGRVRLTMHEMITDPPPVAFAMFQLARCGNSDAPEYFRRLGILFERQGTIFTATSLGAAVAILVSIGAEWNLSEAQVKASFNDEAGRERILRSVDEADRRGVNSTPTFFLNGQRLADDFQQPEVLVRTLDAASRR